MAARSGWINWDALGEEAVEDAAGLNYDYEFVVVDPGSHTFTHLCSFRSNHCHQSINAFDYESSQR